MITTSEAIQVSAVSSRADYRVIHKLRRQVFVKEMGYVPQAIERESGLLRFAMGQGALFLARYRGKPAGTLAIDWWRGLPLNHPDIRHMQMQSFADAFGAGSVCTVRKWLVRPELRSTPIGRELIRAAADFVAEHHEIRFAMIDCDAALLRFYTKLGFRRYGQPFCYRTGGAVSLPMCMVVSDLDHLEGMHSPIHRMLRDRGRRHRDDVTSFFETHHSTSAEKRDTALASS